MGSPSITVVVTVDDVALHQAQFHPQTVRPYVAFTIPVVKEFRADGVSVEDAVKRLLAVIRSYTHGNRSRLVTVLSVPLDELVVEEVLNG